MTHVTKTLFIATLIAIADPSFAGTAGADLPRMTFPPPTEPAPDQGCAARATLSDSRCDNADD